MNKSFNLFFGILIVSLTLVSCKRAEVIELPMTIIIDHQLNSSSISSDKDLEGIISPFNIKNIENNRDSILVSPKFVIKRIDLKDPLEDSLSEKDNGIFKKASDWLTGGTKNAVRYEKMQRRKINGMTLFSGISTAIGDKQFVDTFLFHNNIEYIFFVKTDSAFNHYKNLNIRVFINLDSLQNYIRSNLNLAKSGKKKINIFYDPIFQYEKVNGFRLVSKVDSIKPVSSDTIIAKVGDPPVSGVKLPPPPPPPPPPPTIKEIYDPRIQYCRSIFNDDDKLIYFFTEIFRFIKGKSFESAEYKLLLNEIAQILLFEFPAKKDASNQFKTSFLISCSNKTDFIKECSEINSSINIVKLDNVFNAQCPPLK
jgi:hypothetical protein